MVLVLKCRHHHDGDEVRLSVPLELVTYRKSIDVGEHQVQQDQFGLLLGNGRQHLRTRIELDRYEIAGPDETGQDIIGVALIVDDQNGARHGQNSKSLRKLARFLALTTTKDVAQFIFTRQGKGGKGLEPSRSGDHRLHRGLTSSGRSGALRVGLGRNGLEPELNSALPASVPA